MRDIILANNKTGGTAMLTHLAGKKPLFMCVIGVTETAKIQGISAAGANPEITDYTPPADVELLQLGKCKCIPGVPVTGWNSDSRAHNNVCPESGGHTNSCGECWLES